MTRSLGGQRSMERLGCKMTRIKVAMSEGDVDCIIYAACIDRSLRLLLKYILQSSIRVHREMILTSKKYKP
jgi:hypothetical protein